MKKKSELAFDKYMSNYDMTIKPIRYKYYHSYEVEHLMKELSKKLKINQEETEISELIGLLHDIGRFEQVRKYGKCSDVLTHTDHADESCVYLFDENHIRDFIDNDSYDDIINDAIRYHNKYRVGENVKGKNLFFSQMIRDMDKVDIYRVISEEYKYTFDKNKISEKVLNDFRNHITINSYDIKTKADEILCHTALVFEITFKESYEILNNKKYLDSYFKVITPKNGSKQFFNEIKEEVYNFIKEKINN